MNFYIQCVLYVTRTIKENISTHNIYLHLEVFFFSNNGSFVQGHAE